MLRLSKEYNIFNFWSHTDARTNPLIFYFFDMFVSVLFREGFYSDYRLKLKLNPREFISYWSEFCHYFTWFEPIYHDRFRVKPWIIATRWRDLLLYFTAFGAILLRTTLYKLDERTPNFRKYRVGYSIHLSNLGANMSMSRWGSPSLRASVRQDFMADFTSSIMLLAFSAESI